MKINRYLLLSTLLNCILLVLIYQSTQQMTLSILIVFLLLAMNGLLFRHFYRLHQEFNKINETVESILEGNLDTRINSTYYKDNRELNANLNRLAKRMEKMSFKKDEDEQTINILTNNITSPIIYIDIDGKIRYINNPFKTQFKEVIQVNDLYEKITIKKLYKYIDDAFILESNQKDTLNIFDHFYQANAITIKNNLQRFVGILFIFHDITELKKYEKLQREYLADASHELKTPISAIKGASEILLNGEHDLETIKDFLFMIKVENERMEKLVRDILLISRLENETTLLYHDIVNLNELIQEIITMVKLKLSAKKQHLVIDLESNLLINGDYDRLKHAFLNLVSNAISYTNDEQSIFITGKKKDDKIIITIKDEGIGIEEKDLPHIFERFYRVDKARSRETGGTGLGLSIVKSTLDVHKASIEVESKIGMGSSFTISFKGENEKDGL
jgi:two-component system, OmpR family, phosphate regulon sensor histidine kinase PhoR